MRCMRGCGSAAQVYDGHRDEALCWSCCCPSCGAAGWVGECAYCCEFVIDYISIERLERFRAQGEVMA